MLGILIWLCVFGLWLPPVYCQCGGELTGMSGDLYAPDLDGDFEYDPNLDCTWTITAEPSNVIELQFYYIDIEYHSLCIYDYVEVYDDGALLGRYCGEETPPVLTSTTNEIVIVFHSDDSIQQYGFGAVYFQRQSNGTADENPCGPDLTDFVGKLVSVDLDFNGNYDNDVNCTWEISPTVPADKIVEVRIIKMDIPSNEDCSLDYLEIYDEYGSYGVFCGSSLPPTSIRPGSDVFYVSFYSDDSINGKGFEALYVVKGIDGKCGGIIMLSWEGEGIKSADRDGNGEYDENSHCVWVIVAPDEKSIELIFFEFDIEEDDSCGFDYIEVYDGQFSFEASKGRFCGSEIPSTITSRSNVLYLEFYADESISYSGFGAIFLYIDAVPVESTTTLSFTTTQPVTVSTTDSTTEQTTTTTSTVSTTLTIETSEIPTDTDPNLCGPVYDGISGVFGSVDNDLDGFYDNGVNCTWIFHADTFWPKTVQSGVEIQITKMDIPSDDACRLDHFEIYDDNNSYGVFCGSSLPPNILVTSLNFSARFYSDDSINGEGFEAYFAVKDEDELCGGILRASTGTIESVDRDGDGKYDLYVYCVWVIIAPKSKHIELKFTYFDLEDDTDCGYDSVELYDGQFISEASIGLFCGYQLPLRTVTSSNVLYFEFYSDSSVAGTGFYADYSYTDSGEPADYSTTPLPTTSEIPTSPDLCGPTFTSLAGYFDWTGTTSSQDNGVNCLWIFNLTAIVDTALTIQIVMNIDIPSEDDCQLDYLEIYDENSSFGVFCGSWIQEEIVLSTSGVFYAKFYSNSENIGNDNSFAAVYTVFDEDGHCGGVLTQPSGFIEAVDRNGDGLYDFDEHCVWAISALYDQRIELEFSYIDIEEDNECFYDFVEVYDGQFNTKESIGRFCGSDTPPTIHSTYPAVFLEFYADSSYGGTGFGASFSFQQAVCESCGCNLTAPSGWFTSPDADGDGYYEDDLDCYWEIIADEGKLIDFQFLEIEIEYHLSCIYDFVQVLDGGQYLLGEYCGTTVPPFIRSQKNMLLVHFHSDSDYTEKGFKASYSHVEWSGPKFCDYIQPVEIGTLNSSALDYDSDGLYDHNMDCVWALTVLDDKRVQVYITNMDIPSSDNCEFDYLEIYDYNISIGIFCGTSQPPLITSTSNTLYIYFYSDATINGKGFQAYFSKIDKDLQCGEMLTSGSGTISSTDRDDDGRYDSSLDCIWTIIAPVGQIIKLQFHFVNMEGWGWSCTYDVVKIFDGHYTDATPVEEICGYGITPTLWSSSRIFYVSFHTDITGSFEGFNASYSVHEAGSGPTSNSTNASTESYTITSTETSTVSAKTATETSTWLSPKSEGSSSSFGLSTESASATDSHITKATTVTDKTSNETSTLMSTQDESSTSSLGPSAGSSSVTSSPTTEESTTVTDKTSMKTSTFFFTEDGGYTSPLGSSIASSAMTRDAMTEKLTTVTDTTSTETSKIVSTQDESSTSSLGSSAGSSSVTSSPTTEESTTVTDKTSLKTSTFFFTEDGGYTSSLGSSNASSAMTSDATTEKLTTVTDTTSTETSKIVSTQDESSTSSLGSSAGSSSVTSSPTTEESTTVTDKTSMKTSTFFFTEDGGYTSSLGSSNASSAMTSDATTEKLTTVTDTTSTETSKIVSTKGDGLTSSMGSSTESSVTTSGSIMRKTTTETSTLFTQYKGNASYIRSSMASSSSSHITEETSVVTDKTSTETSTVLATEDQKYTSFPGSSIKSSDAKSSDKTETASVTDKTSMETSTVLSTQDKKHTSARGSSVERSTVKSTDLTTGTTTDKTSSDASTKVSTENDGQTASVRTGTAARSSSVTETTPVTDKTSTEASTMVSTEREKHTTGKGSSTEVERSSVTTSSDMTKVTTETTTSVKVSSHGSTRGVISSTDGTATESSRTPPVTNGTTGQAKQSYSKSISSTVTTNVETHKKSTLSEILTDYRTFTAEMAETTERSYAVSYRVTVYRMTVIYILICLFILQLH